MQAAPGGPNRRLCRVGRQAGGTAHLRRPAPLHKGLQDVSQPVKDEAGVCLIVVVALPELAVLRQQGQGQAGRARAAVGATASRVGATAPAACCPQASMVAGQQQAQWVAHRHHLGAGRVLQEVRGLVAVGEDGDGQPAGQQGVRRGAGRRRRRLCRAASLRLGTACGQLPLHSADFRCRCGCPEACQAPQEARKGKAVAQLHPGHVHTVIWRDHLHPAACEWRVFLVRVAIVMP